MVTDSRMIMPVTEAQWWMWFMQQGFYDARMAARISLPGPLDASALRAAWGDLTGRHEALRTVYRVHHDQLVQAISADGDIDATFVESETVSDDDQSTLSGLLAEVSELDAVPPLRIVGITSTDGSAKAVIVAHHIACDGWGLEIIRREMLALYQMHALDVPSFLPPPPREQLGAQALWETNREGSESLDGNLQYWLQRLHGAPISARLRFPQPTAGADKSLISCDFTMSSSVVERVAQVARAARATPWTVVFAAYRVALLRSDGEGDVVVSANVLNRRREVLKAVGHFTKPLFFRDQIDESMTFTQVVSRVNSQTRADLAHSFYDQSRLYESGIRLARQSGMFPPPTRLAMNFDFITDRTAVGAPLENRRYEVKVIGPGIECFQCVVEWTARGCSGRLITSDNLCSARSLSEFADEFLAALQDCSLHPDVKLGSLPWSGGNPTGPTRALAHNSMAGVAVTATKATILQRPEVLQCQLEPVPNDGVGERSLRARIVLEPDCSASIEEISRRLFVWLPATPGADPSLEILVDSSAHGLPDRIGDSIQAVPGRHRLDEAGSDTERRLLGAVAEVLGHDVPNLACTWWDLGLGLRAAPSLSRSLVQHDLPCAITATIGLPFSLKEVASLVDSGGLATGPHIRTLWFV